MAKRVVDGEGIWRSEKIARVQPPSFRAEYTNLLPLANANGTFECDPRRIWSQVYSFNRPDITEQNVREILDEFDRTGLLFRFCEENTGKMWGFWIGIDRPGRLPSASRLKNRHEILGPTPPQEALQKYVASHRLANGQPMAALGFGLGFGLGSGSSEAKNASDSSCPASPDEGVSASHLAVESTVSIPAMELANLLRQLRLENNPRAKITARQVHDWGVNADLMLRLDHRTAEEITAIIQWSQRDDFWKSNILSMGKLREKFDQLAMKQNGEKAASEPAWRGRERVEEQKNRESWQVISKLAKEVRK
jgi:hypothetical protein